jgi:uncharacterized protein
MADSNDERLALIPALAGQSPSGYIGRTALMKYIYFLQALRNVPLGYRFTLYSYGPFDSDVLADLASAETLNVVKSDLATYLGGYGYRISPAERAEWSRKRSSAFLSHHKEDVKWVLHTFGSYTSAELELLATIVFVDREAQQKKERIRLNDLVKRVHEVKPHFSEDKIQTYANRLIKEKLLAYA